MLEIQYNGLTINDSNFTTNGICITKIQGVDGLGVRTSENLLTGQDGGIIFNQLADMRVIAFEGWVQGMDGDVDEFFAFKRALVRAFAINTSNILRITRWGQTAETKSIKARVVLTPQPTYEAGKIYYVDWRVELKCEDPYFDDGTDTSYIINLAENGGFPVPGPVLGPIGNAEGNRATIDNTGDKEAYPKSIKIEGYVDTPTINNLTTGKSFSINKIINAGDYVVLGFDQYGFYVFLNGATNYLTYFYGDFFKLAQGENIVSFTANGYSASAKVTVVWANKHLSL